MFIINLLTLHASLESHLQCDTNVTLSQMSSKTIFLTQKVPNGVYLYSVFASYGCVYMQVNQGLQVCLLALNPVCDIIITLSYSSLLSAPVLILSPTLMHRDFCLPADKVLPSVLQKAEVSLMSQTDCKKSYGLVSPRMLCAGVPSGERDACRVSSIFYLFI